MTAYLVDEAVVGQGARLVEGLYAQFRRQGDIFASRIGIGKVADDSVFVQTATRQTVLIELILYSECWINRARASSRISYHAALILQRVNDGRRGVVALDTYYSPRGEGNHPLLKTINERRTSVAISTYEGRTIPKRDPEWDSKPATWLH